MVPSPRAFGQLALKKKKEEEAKRQEEEERRAKEAREAEAAGATERVAVAETGDAAGAGAGAGAGAAVSASAGGAAPITGLFGARPAKAGRAMKPAQLRVDKGSVLLVLAGHARWLALVVRASAGGGCVWV